MRRGLCECIVYRSMGIAGFRRPFETSSARCLTGDLLWLAGNLRVLTCFFFFHQPGPYMTTMCVCDRSRVEVCPSLSTRSSLSLSPCVAFSGLSSIPFDLQQTGMSSRRADKPATKYFWECRDLLACSSLVHLPSAVESVSVVRSPQPPPPPPSYFFPPPL